MQIYIILSLETCKKIEKRKIDQPYFRKLKISIKVKALSNNVVSGLFHVKKFH